jgi:hypothetical protein
LHDYYLDSTAQKRQNSDDDGHETTVRLLYRVCVKNNNNTNK